MMRLTMVIPSLGFGGAERVISIMANYWAERGEKVTVLTFDNGEVPSYPLHQEVTHNSLGLTADSEYAVVGLLRNLSRVRILRRAIRKSQPDLVVSFIDKINVLTLLATRGLGIPTVVSERTDPSQYDIGRVWTFLRRLTYPLADALVCQTPVALAYFDSFMGTNRHVIPNPVMPPPAGLQTNGRRGPNGKDRHIIAMGRLVEEKGFDLLLQAFGSIAMRHPDWSLTILGEGSLRRKLEEQVEILGLTGRAQLTGQDANPFSILQKADLFVLSSRFEGFPNALCEAMACGLPVVSFDCPSGPGEIIREGVNGILVPPEDSNALAGALDRLMGDSAERERLAKHATDVLDQFGVDAVMSKWDALFGRINKS